jgi:hypothetical protein
MQLSKILFALSFTVGLTAFATTPKGLTATAKRLSKAEIAAAGLSDPADHPQGYYVSEDGDLTMRITKGGFVKPDFGVLLTNGTKAALEFPRKLRYIEDEEIYRTRGETSLAWSTNLGVLTCRYDVTLEIDDLSKGDSLRVRARVPQNMGLDAFGRCITIGSRTITVRFNRE